MATRQETKERREKLKVLVESIGLWNINQSTMAQQFGITHQQISKDLKIIIKTLQPDEIGTIKANLYLAYKKAISKTQSIMSTGTKKEQLDAARTLALIGDRFTKMLEDYSIKEKVPDVQQLEHTGSVNIIAPEWWYNKQDATNKSRKALQTTSKTRDLPPK